MNAEAEQLQAAIAALQAQRALLGDAVVEVALAPMRARLATLQQTTEAQQLKQVSILFADIVGSTTLTRQLDPEEVHAVMDGTLAHFTAAVQAQQGRVLQYAGDSMLAVFGAHAAREDDAERAVRAALAVLRGGARQGEWVRQQHGHEGFNVRVGVHTGPVLLGGGVDGDGTIRGISVNIAARLEQSAPPGQLRISQATWQQVRGLFVVTAQPPLAVKGVDEPLVSYLVQAERPRPWRDEARGVAGLATPMVGRQHELQQLQQALRALGAETSSPAARCVLVVGEAGLGKSRLALEFERWLAALPAPPTVLRARAVPQNGEQPYSLLRTLLADWLQIHETDASALACSKLEAGLVPLFAADQGSDLAQAQAHVLGYLLGFDFGDSRHLAGLREAGGALRSRAFHVAAQALRRGAAQAGTPLVLLLEDLHWADDGSLRFFKQLLQVNADLPMLMLGLTRAALFERQPRWPADRPADDGDGAAVPCIQRLTLQALDAAGCQLLAEGLLQRLPGAPAELLGLIVQRAEGNPFYMEELVKMLIDEGAIVVPAGDPSAPDAAPWQLHPERLRLDRVPVTLTGVLQARLDSLAASDRASLQRASVIGLQFWDEALAELDAAAPRSLPVLMLRQLVREQQATVLAQAQAFGFAHQLLHQVTYDTVLKRVRTACHLQVGNWLAGLASARANDLLGLAASHFERGGEAERAAEFYTRSAEQLSTRFAHDTVVTHAGRALALASPDDHALRWRALLVRQRSLRLQGRMPEQAADLDALTVAAEALDDDQRRATVRLRRAVAAASAGDAKGCVAACAEALSLAQHGGAHDVTLSIYSAWAGALLSLGRYDEARRVSEDGLALARQRGNQGMESELLTGLAAGASQQGDALRAIAWLQQCLQIDREIGRRINEGPVLVNLGDATMRLGDFEAARGHLQDALQLARATGDRNVQAMCLLNLASVTHLMGEHATALGHARAARQLTAEVGNREYEAFAWMSLGHAEAGLGHADEAREAYAHSRERLLELDLPHLALEADAGLALVALAEGDVGAALAHLEALLAALARGDALDGCEHPLWMRLTAVQVLRQAGDGRAAAQLAEAQSALQTQADAISDAAARQRFLQQVPHHRQILALAAADG
ncbi:MAG: hypothetical protein A3E25_09725 [Burkholderiales bacterium RIFCSPHIGHO2_12_FULL_69_20]|nr:MAG: hypothetical protein A3E25_09725 [Burkholderiales bacterium RIFCSPHIGHO2_12_FULL_69_20]